LATLSGLAAADSSVQVFGIIDAGVLAQNKSPQGGSLTRVETSGLRQSVWGFKGSEDLGHGLKAFFNLESHFDTDTGALHPSGDTPGSGTILFRRQANVGLSSDDWGSITIGRQYGPALLAHIGTEPRAFKEQFSNLYAWAYNQLESIAGPDAVNSNNDVGIFMKNAIQYRNTFGPVSLGVLYSFGEQDDFSDNSIVAVGASYTGPVVVSASYEYMKDRQTGNKNVEHTGLGFALPYGDFTFKANWLRAENSGADGARTSKVDAWGVGADYKWHASNNATIAYYDNKDKEHHSNHTKNLVLSNDYFFSKRTTLYAQLAVVDADDGAVGAAALKTSIVADGSFEAGETTTFLNIGLNHTF
jgi:predicted porin